jgi:IPT/TIG domain
MGHDPSENDMKTVNYLVTALLILIAVACGGYGSKTSVAGALPAISQLSPGSASMGGAGFTLTINGSNFASNATVNWNGTAQTTTVISSSQLTIPVSSAMIANSGSVQITVTNPATSSGMYGGGTMAETSSPMMFTIN